MIRRLDSPTQFGLTLIKRAFRIASCVSHEGETLPCKNFMGSSRPEGLEAAGFVLFLTRSVGQKLIKVKGQMTV
jgi:hypothetical protein